jgi:Pregnancy-associated plasma protein-A/Secretion system C-terminal sorting domain
MRLFSYIFIFFILIKNIEAQSICATSHYDAPPSVEKQIQDWILKNKNTLQQRSIVTIPIVVHIIYNTEEENIPDADIIKQIEILNRDFRRRNPDTTATPSVWKALGADIEIEFCLASRDTLGNPTNGITHNKTLSVSFNNQNRVKSLSTGGVKNWNPRKYLNVWVANLNTQLYGFGTYPTSLNSNPNADGVVINYRNFYRQSQPVQGRVLVHEVGHWFNLLHIFGDSVNTHCGARTDFIDDTPTQYTSTGGCPVFPRRDNCTPVGDGIMYMNYMDYTNENCMNMFTLGQKARMWAALNLYRSEILQSDACLSTPTSDITLPPFTISPNPSNYGYIKLEFATIGADLTITNILGQTVFNKKNINESEVIDLTTQQKGMYFITLKKGGRFLTRKLILEQM